MNRIILAIALLPLPAFAQQVSDAALAECQAQHQSYTEVMECLPLVETAHRMLAAISTEEVFAPAASNVLPWCKEHNELTANVWQCVHTAITDAGKLLEMVGDPSRINDPRFATIASPGATERLSSLIRTAMEEFGPGVGHYVIGTKHFE
ncbi:hypothetical protein [Seohaeicola zhoushanensis]|nr:hypothetical protein [Seohaeicola zhoushanensis]